MKNLLIILSLLTLSFSAFAEEPTVAEQSVVPIEVLEQSAEPYTPNQLWDMANTAYINADFVGAIELYNLIEQQGLRSDTFYFNLGNAHYKNGDIARAILYYQKALLISPSDQDIIYNLGVAQSQTRDQISEIPEFFLRRWSRSISRLFGCTGWSVISIVALVLLLSSVLLFLLGGAIRLRKVGFGVGLFMAVVFVLSTSYALGERREILDHNKGVIMSQSISIKSSPDRSSTDLFMLHSGTTVTILREMDSWLEVVIADGKKGWIESRRVEEI